MIKKFFSTKLSKVIIIILIGGLLLVWNPSNFFKPVRSILKDAFSPFQKVIYLLTLKLYGFREYTSSIAQLRSRNEMLMNENLILKAENARLRDAERQNQILREQLDLLPKEKFNLENAFVIGQNPKFVGDWIEISKGLKSGIKVGMPVIASRGILVGIVDETSNYTSRVMLITNHESALSAMINSSGAKGIARGSYGLGLTFDMVLQTEEIKPGDELITAGSPEYVPRGIFIGTLKEISNSSDQLFQQATVDLPLDFGKLEVVSVIKEVK